MISRRVGKECISVTLHELMLLSKNTVKLSLSSSAFVQETRAGQHSSTHLGRGMEFSECRRYQGGDDIRSIDWRVTARTGKVHTKLFTEEKERDVFICLDLCKSMFFASKGVFKSVQASLLAASVGWSAIKMGHSLGGLIVENAHLHAFKPKPSKKGLLSFLQKTAEIEPPHGEIKKNDTIDKAIEKLRQMATLGSLIFILSDFRGLTSRGSDLIGELAQRSEVRLILISDWLERTFPKNGIFSVTDGKNVCQLNTFDNDCLEKYQKQFEERRDFVSSMARFPRVEFIECGTEDDCLEKLKTWMTFL